LAKIVAVGAETHGGVEECTEPVSGETQGRESEKKTHLGRRGPKDSLFLRGDRGSAEKNSCTPPRKGEKKRVKGQGKREKRRSGDSESRGQKGNTSTGGRSSKEEPTILVQKKKTYGRPGEVPHQTKPGGETERAQRRVGGTGC